MKKKLLSILLVSTMTVGLIAGCAKKEPAEKADLADKTVDIRLQIEWAADSGRGIAIQEVLNAFTAKNPNIKVTLLGGAQDTQKTITQLLSSDAPEVMQVPYRNIKALAPQGAFADLTSDFSGEKANYYEQIWDLAQIDNVLYGVPWLGHSIQLVYNKTMFEKEGITKAPTTWDELYETAKKLTKDTNGDGKPDVFGLGLSGKQGGDTSWMTNMFVYQAGGKLVEKDAKGNYVVALNNEAGIKGLEMYAKLAKEVAPPDTATKGGGEVMADFRNQVVAMEFQGPWGVTDIWKNGNPFEVGVAEVPAGPGGRASEVGPYMLSVPTSVQGDKFEAAKMLISYLTSKEGQELVLKGEKADDGNYYPFRMPIRKDMADIQYFKDHPEMELFIKGLEYPSISSPTEGWTKVDAQIYQSELNKLIIGNKSAAEVAKTVEEQGNKLLQQ